MTITAIDQILAIDILNIETLRSLSTVLAFIAFIAVCLWAYSRKRHDAFEQAANLPFADEPNHSAYKNECEQKNYEEKNP